MQLRFARALVVKSEAGLRDGHDGPLNCRHHDDRARSRDVHPARHRPVLVTDVLATVGRGCTRAPAPAMIMAAPPRNVGPLLPPLAWLPRSADVFGVQ
ncbi:hypothetical protein ABZ208_29860 [Streptomyces sp. NPDC006208]|uniref:hypothetical protein n=1 Tax=Streptomyces sp. NPDC006208 TaxID=3156734 RepID=UPI0033B449E7